MSITLTEAAVKSFENKLLKQDKTYVRLGVKGSGCSGFEYVIKFDSSKKEKDTEFIFGNLKIIIDPKSILFLDGISIDWISNIKEQKFQINNPKVDKTCGCSKSFSIK